MALFSLAVKSYLASSVSLEKLNVHSLHSNIHGIFMAVREILKNSKNSKSFQEFQKFFISFECSELWYGHGGYWVNGHVFFCTAVQCPDETYGSSVLKLRESKIVHYSVMHLSRQCFACDICVPCMYLKGWVANFMIVQDTGRGAHMFQARGKKGRLLIPEIEQY